MFSLKFVKSHGLPISIIADHRLGQLLFRYFRSIGVKMFLHNPWIFLKETQLYGDICWPTQSGSILMAVAGSIFFSSGNTGTSPVFIGQYLYPRGNCTEIFFQLLDASWNYWNRERTPVRVGFGLILWGYYPPLLIHCKKYDFLLYFSLWPLNIQYKKYFLWQICIVVKKFTAENFLW